MSANPSSGAPGLPEIDINEWGGKGSGIERQTMNARLFMQLLVWDVPRDVPVVSAEQALMSAMREHNVASVVYHDCNAPRGLALLTWSSDPSHFVKKVRPIFASGVLADLQPRQDHTMIGRTYSQGHEPDLAHALLRRSVENVLREGWDWSVWYPLRRKGAFETLPREEQVSTLREHAGIGMAYGKQELAHDIRLACHGIDQADNEFVIGLVGKDLHPLSHVVQTMRKTKQTAQYIEKMGPFFVGYAVQKLAG